MASRSDSGAARRIEKARVKKAKPSPGSRLSWPEVLRCLSSDETRSCVATWLRGTCFSPDTFATSRLDRRFVAVALSKAEDQLELRGPATKPERERIRAVRRRLEWEIWQ